ncbi:MAG TPA: hypothetical protein VHD32_13570 [Candidatus Didemnitutus sp.]|nr:hypothetical protein [Candidatus Didemnitutus sp.]
MSAPLYKLLQELARSGYAARTEAAVAEEMIRKGLSADELLTDFVKKRVLKGKTS